jgi:lipopolysaccharide transport system permease protein
VPDQLRWVIELNPMTWVVTNYRNVVLDGRPPDATLAWLFLLGGLLCCLGYVWFRRCSLAFADVV